MLDTCMRNGNLPGDCVYALWRAAVGMHCGEHTVLVHQSMSGYACQMRPEKTSQRVQTSPSAHTCLGMKAQNRRAHLKSFPCEAGEDDVKRVCGQRRAGSLRLLRSEIPLAFAEREWRWHWATVAAGLLRFHAHLVAHPAERHRHVGVLLGCCSGASPCAL